MDRSSFKQRLVIALCALLALPLCALLALPLCVSARNLVSPENGEWALRGSPPQIISHLYARIAPSVTSLDIVQYRRGSLSPITAYMPVEQQIMHLILIRDDFREFTHLHPQLTGGQFVAPVALASGHRYYVYADSTPLGMHQQVFRFVVIAGRPPTSQHTPINASATVARVGPYNVRISATRLIAGRPSTLYLDFNKSGKPATDIFPYRGSPAHAALINTSDLSYLHVDPVISAPRTQARMRLDLPPISSTAAYKLWLQFRGGNIVYTAPFTLVTR